MRQQTYISSLKPSAFVSELPMRQQTNRGAVCSMYSTF